MNLRTGDSMYPIPYNSHKRQGATHNTMGFDKKIISEGSGVYIYKLVKGHVTIFPFLGIPT